MDGEDDGEGPLGELIRALLEMAAKTADSDADEFDLRKVLRFITKVVQIVDDSFEEVYALLLEVSSLTPKAIEANRHVGLAKEFRMLLAKSHFRDASEICSRLRYLAENYAEEIRPIMDREEIIIDEWASVFSLIDAYEGSIINDIEGIAQDISGELDQLTPETVKDMRATALSRAKALEGNLRTLRDLKGQILGLSGSKGLLELTTGQNRDSIRQVIANIDIARGGTIVEGDNYQNVSGNIVQGSPGTTIIQNSVLEDAMKTVRGMADQDTATALKDLAGYVEKSGNKEAIEAMQGMTEELAKEEPRKSNVKLFWERIVKLLPDTAKVVAGAATLAKLFI